MEEFQSDGGESECSELKNLNAASTKIRVVNGSRRKNSFVWKYFRPIEGNDKSYECVICNGCVGCQTSNLARHLAASHDITKQVEQGVEHTGRGRSSRSFIWKFCTKEDSKHARCHLCQKVLYFGGGNTSNISKHLRRRHLNQIENNMEDVDGVESAMAAVSILKVEAVNGDAPSSGGKYSNSKSLDQSHIGSGRKERKGGSYVWNYCDKLSRHTIRCNLCNKMMSFHGTANVITHLQRRHNIVGKVENDINRAEKIDNDNSTAESNVVDESGTGEHLDATLSEVGDMGDAGEGGYVKRQRRSLASTSIVWKYCTRISTDAVRCGFCKKNLSYQGTSNLQRHLHRMHGVVTQGRLPKDAELSDQQYKQLSNSNFVWEHCSLVDDGRIKCNMCSAIFSSKEMEDVSRHLAVTHAVEPRRPGRRSSRPRVDFKEDSTDDEEKDDFDDDWSKLDGSEDGPTLETNIKKDDSLYGDIIEEEPEHSNYDEDPFDPTMLQETPLENPLSAQSSRAGSPDTHRRPLQRNHLQNKKMQKLNEDRVRMETEYFREKAGFYRMQKYLTALQAKKVRIEVDRLNSGNDLNEATYVGDMQQSLQNLPTAQ